VFETLVFLPACVEVTIVVGATPEILAVHLPTKEAVGIHKIAQLKITSYWKCFMKSWLHIELHKCTITEHVDIYAWYIN